MRPDASKKLAAAAPKAGRNPVIIGAVVAVLIIVAVVVAIVSATRGTSGGTTASALPSGVVGGEGGGMVANATPAKGNAPTLDIYEDFQCPACGDLEKRVGAEVTSLATAGEVKVVLHILTFLDTNLKNDSSTRSANAATCAADSGKLLGYHAAVFAAQPAQEGVGYTDAQLTEFAGTSGITGDSLTTWQKCTTSAQHDDYINEVQTAAEKAGVFNTPTVKLNGQDITKSLAAPGDLTAQVKAATK